MESQSGHHPGHHGHSAPHSSTLPHNIHVGGSSHHQINLDNHGHHHHHQKSQEKNPKHKKEAVEAHKPHSTHHTHHHVSRKSVLGDSRELLRLHIHTYIRGRNWEIGKCKVFEAIAQRNKSEMRSLEKLWGDETRLR